VREAEGRGQRKLLIVSCWLLEKAKKAGGRRGNREQEEQGRQERQFKTQNSKLSS
jgi:hypothetical protein